MHPLVFLAKKSVEMFVKKGEIISPPADFPLEFLTKQGGVFVTIEKNGSLRGCIGTYLPLQQNIAQEVIYNAISAASEDYRFDPVKEEELPFLSYFVYLLDPPELVKSLDELNPQKYGILVKTKNKSGLLLPSLPGIETKEEQISLACQKAGINPEKESFLVYKFSAKKLQ